MGVTAEPSEGDPAPDFELPEAYGGQVVLSEVLREHTAVLAFHPSPFGVMCAVEMNQFKAMYGSFHQSGAEVLGINTCSRPVQAAWRERLDLPFPQLADFYGRVSGAYGVLAGEEGALRGRCNRAVFVVDRGGIIRYRWDAGDIVQAEEPDYDEVLAVCRALAAELTPSPAPAGSTR